MSDEMNKYPATQDWLRQLDLCKSRPMFCITVNMNEVEAEIKSLLAARQRDEEMIRGLVDVLQRLSAFPFSHQGVAQGPLFCILSQAKAAINAAELRLKEGGNGAA